MATMIYRCKRCNLVHRVAMTGTRGHIGYGRYETTYRRNDGKAGPELCDCGRAMVGNMLKANLNPAVKCAARCTHAVGFDCECSCGGKNHGAGMFSGLIAA